MPRVYETMRRAEIKATADPQATRFVVRLWLDTESQSTADRALAHAMRLASEAESTRQAAKVIARLVTFVNAVEVVDGQGNGSLVFLL